MKILVTILAFSLLLSTVSAECIQGGIQPKCNLDENVVWDNVECVWKCEPKILSPPRIVKDIIGFFAKTNNPSLGVDISNFVFRLHDIILRMQYGKVPEEVLSRRAELWSEIEEEYTLPVIKEKIDQTIEEEIVKHPDNTRVCMQGGVMPKCQPKERIVWDNVDCQFKCETRRMEMPRIVS